MSMIKEMLTADDVAEYLHIHKNQIYRLVKDKRLPGTRITGKWLFPKRLVDEWIINSAKETASPPEKKDVQGNQIVVAGSNDLALEVLTKNVQIQSPDITISLSNTGSLAGLFALQRGSCHMAAAHLLDTETGEYNSPCIRKNFPELKVRVVNLAYREQGLILKKGNPLGINNLHDLMRKKAIFINRQEGSGTRVLLDFKLKENKIDPLEIPGYATMAYAHLEVALAVFRGAADVGMGIRAAAKLLDLDFIPIANERFDLIIPNECASIKAISALFKSLNSEDLRSQISHMGGYEMRDTGKVMYEA
jgi:putative molybdopterin biosynthesis protein